MSPGDIVHAHEESWILLQLLYVADGKQYALARQADSQAPCEPKVICWEVE